MTKLNGRKPYHIPTYSEFYSSSGHHEIEFNEYVHIEEEMEEYELDDFQHKDDATSLDYQIIKHLEETIAKVIIGTLHHEMMVMLGSQYVIFLDDPNRFLNEYSLSKCEQYSSGLYHSNKVCYQSINFSQDASSFQFYY